MMDSSSNGRFSRVQFSSTQHAEPLKAVQSKRLPGVQGPDESAPGMEDMRKLIEEQVIKKTLEVRLNPTRGAVNGRPKHRS